MNQTVLMSLCLSFATAALADEPLAEAALPEGAPVVDAGVTVKPVEADLFSLESAVQLEVPNISAASKKLEKATSSPAATIILLTRDDIRVRGYENLKDIFRDLPGMESIE